jgi:hypothetical protein
MLTWFSTSPGLLEQREYVLEVSICVALNILHDKHLAILHTLECVAALSDGYISHLGI